MNRKENCARRTGLYTKDTSDTKDTNHLVVSVLRCRNSPTKGNGCILSLNRAFGVL